MTDWRTLVFQFRVSLDGIKPTIWRRIQVPADYSFWDLHVAIQDAMGWEDYHLHDFQIKNPDTQALIRIGIPDEDFGWSEDILAGWLVKIADYFNEKNRLAKYGYDFGDGWMHRVRLEKIETSQPHVKYPLCLGGERSCPPEDVGGVGGYASFLEIISNPKHKEHDRMLEWVGGDFNPEQFDVDKISFCDPKERWNSAFGEESAG